MPKLSVIVPVYNTEKYLRECIDSILAQTFTDFELILVDDGSTDSSGAICDEYAEKDSRIQVIHQQNGGATLARRSGVRRARGEYITFVDSDDWIHRDMYHILLSQEPADILICNMFKSTGADMLELISGVTPGTYDKQALADRIYPTMLFDYDRCQPAVHPSLCTKLIREDIIRDVIERVSDDVTYGEDALCSFACILAAERIHMTGKSLYYYRENPDSVSNVYNVHMFSTLIKLGEEMKRMVVTHNSSLCYQLSGYLARNALECIRNELLYNTDATYKDKRARILRFISNPLLKESFHLAASRIKDSKTRLKMILVKYRLIAPLYLLYLSRNSLAQR